MAGIYVTIYGLPRVRLRSGCEFWLPHTFCGCSPRLIARYMQFVAPRFMPVAIRVITGIVPCACWIAIY